MKKGFSLIELLIVITIIGILAGLAVPVYQGVVKRAKQTSSLNNVKQIGLACKTYAMDNEGLYPATSVPEITTSTEAFRELQPDPCSNERVFHVSENRNNKVKRPNDDDELEVEENCYSYVKGLTDSSKASYPLIAEEFTAGGTRYDEKHPWYDMENKKNRGKAVVGFADGSARIMSISLADNVLAPDGETDLFERLPSYCEVLNP